MADRSRGRLGMKQMFALPIALVCESIAAYHLGMFFGFRYTRLTVFHVLWFAAVVAGTYAGAMVGRHFFGLAGAVIGAVLGCTVGHIVGCIPDWWAYRSLITEIHRSTNEQLWQIVAKEEWRFDNTLALLQLGARDVDVDGELPRIIGMLESDSKLTRIYGFDALRIVFTDQYHLIPDYDPRGSLDVCREKVAELRAAIREKAV